MNDGTLAKAERDVPGLIARFESAVNAGASAARNVSSAKSRLDTATTSQYKQRDQYQSQELQKALQTAQREQATAQAEVSRSHKQLKDVASWIATALRDEKSNLHELQKGRAQLDKSSYKPAVEYRRGENATKNIISRCKRLLIAINGAFQKARSASVGAIGSSGISGGLEDMIDSSQLGIPTGNQHRQANLMYGLSHVDGYASPLEEQKERLDHARYGPLLNLSERQYFPPYLGQENTRRGSLAEKAEMGLAFVSGGGTSYQVSLPGHYQRMINGGVAPSNAEGRYAVFERYS